MIGKKINQLATELAPTTTDLTIIGDPVTGVSKKITLEQLGAIFGGAVSFYTTLGDFPATGVIDIIYCAKDTKKLYLWSGSAYVEVFPSQSLLDTYQLRSEKGVSNGYASLDVNGKVPIGQLPNSIMEYKGTWNAATNTPTLANGTGDTGDVYICNAAGTVNFGAGPITFAVGDYVVYSGSIWQRSSGAVGTVTSVGLSITGDSIGVTGSPITTSGTLALAFAGTGAQYIKGDGTLATFPSIISQAQNLVTEVYNNTGATLTKGTIVYINGGQGNLPTVTKALATGDSTSAQTYGVVQTDITNMNNGYVVVAGRLTDLDTQAYSNGTQLYLSSTTAGTWTPTKQYAPNHLVYVGIVVRSHPTQGVVEIKIQNGYELDELHNVAAQSPDNNDILQYKTATSLWTKVAGTTSNIAEGTNLYYTDARSRAALSFTAGSGAYNSTTGVITIPTNTNQLTNGAAFITLASLSAGAGISYNNTTGVIASTITQYTDALARAAISLTTTGTSGAATYNNTTGVLNIPQYQTALTNPVTGTGTTNTLAKFTGSSTIGNSIVSESGSALSVAGSVTGTSFISSGSSSDRLLMTRTSVGSWNLSISATNRFGIYDVAADVERISILSTGNVGIGLSNPAYPLTVQSATDTRINIISSSNNSSGLYLQTLNSGTQTGNATIRVTNGGALQFFNGTTSDAMNLSIASTGAATFSSSVKMGNASSAAIATNSTGADVIVGSGTNSSPAFQVWDDNSLSVPRFIVTRGGNVGIGTTSPATNFNVVKSDNGGEGFARFEANNRTQYVEIGWNSINQWAVTPTNAILGFQVNGTERMRINSSGVIRITSQGITNTATLEFDSDATPSNGSTIAVSYLGSGSYGPLKFGTGGSERMRITSGGNISFNGGSGSTGTSTSSPKNFRFNNDYSNGYTDASLKLYLFNESTTIQGFTSGPNYDLQYHTSGNAAGKHVFYVQNSEIMRITNTNVELTNAIKTGAPANGTAQPWKLGNAVSGTCVPTTFGEFGTWFQGTVIQIEVNGTTYKIPAVIDNYC